MNRVIKADVCEDVEVIVDAVRRVERMIGVLDGSDEAVEGALTLGVADASLTSSGSSTGCAAKNIAINETLGGDVTAASLDGEVGEEAQDLIGAGAGEGEASSGCAGISDGVGASSAVVLGGSDGRERRASLGDGFVN